jgi:hypothetical protein
MTPNGSVAKDAMRYLYLIIGAIGILLGPAVVVTTLMLMSNSEKPLGYLGGMLIGGIIGYYGVVWLRRGMRWTTRLSQPPPSDSSPFP